MAASLKRDSLFSVEGMVFVVTGGGTGIGAMMANTLDLNGASKVFILGRRLEKLQEVASQAAHKSILAVQCDMGVQTEIVKAAEQIASETPFVNAVIANHGAQGPTVYSLPKDRTPTLEEMQKFILDTPMEDFNQTFMVNTTAVFYTFAAFMPLLDAGNKHADSPGKKLGIESQLIVTSSIGSMSKRPGMGYAYSASKAAANLMAKQLSTNMAPYHIRCNLFCPGIYPSDMSTSFMEAVNNVVPPHIVPAERIATSEDAGGLILFLCSRAGGYLNGAMINSDGGRLGIVPSTF